MDIQYLGSILLAVSNFQADHSRLTTEAAVDAYYKRHAGSDNFYPKLVPFVIGLGFIFMAIGISPH
jgi:hypothetical protein